MRTLVLAEPPAFWTVPRDTLLATRDMRAMFELSRELNPIADPTDDQLVRFRCILGSCGMTPPAAGSAGYDDWMARRGSLRGLSTVANHSDDAARLRSFQIVFHLGVVRTFSFDAQS